MVIEVIDFMSICSGNTTFNGLGFVISVYLSSLPVAHLSDALRRRLVITGDNARIQDETTGSTAWFFNVLGV